MSATARRASADGVSKIFTRDADSGYEIHFHFCPQCGSNVYWQASRFPLHYGIAVGAFADPAFPLPSFSVWEAPCTHGFHWRHRLNGLPSASRWALFRQIFLGHERFVTAR